MIPFILFCFVLVLCLVPLVIVATSIISNFGFPTLRGLDSVWWIVLVLFSALRLRQRRRSDVENSKPEN